MSEFSEPCIPSTQVEIGGFTWTIYATTNAETIDQIVKVTKALQKRGYTAPRRATFGQKPPSKPLTRPLINGDGDPCCPFHADHAGRPRPIRFVQARGDLPGFWGCASKGQDVNGETLNANGFCNLRFDWPAESAPQNLPAKRGN